MIDRRPTAAQGGPLSRPHPGPTGTETVSAPLAHVRDASGQRGRDRSRLDSQGNGTSPDGGLPDALLLMEDLIEAIELREAGDPDAPSWEADAEVRRLERALSVVLRTTTGWRLERYDRWDEVARDWD